MEWCLALWSLRSAYTFSVVFLCLHLVLCAAFADTERFVKPIKRDATKHISNKENATTKRAKPPAMVWIRPGSYLPLFSKNKKQRHVRKGFWMDIHPVTNGQFLQFVKKHPEWQRSRVRRLFTERSYLRHWRRDLQLGKLSEKSPVVYISWFPAKAYCQSMGKRLPTIDEWEYVASASKTKFNGQSEKGYNQRILRWYSKPTPTSLPSVMSTFRNVWGVYDMHGLIWEWVLDFNAALISGDSRKNTDLDKKLFCGSGSVGASDFKNYAAFMRYAFRSSLKYNYNTANLGFRCAKGQ